MPSETTAPTPAEDLLIALIELRQLSLLAYKLARSAAQERKQKGPTREVRRMEKRAKQAAARTEAQARRIEDVVAQAARARGLE